MADQTPLPRTRSQPLPSTKPKEATGREATLRPTNPSDEARATTSRATLSSFENPSSNLPNIGSANPPSAPPLKRNRPAAPESNVAQASSSALELPEIERLDSDVGTPITDRHQKLGMQPQPFASPAISTANIPSHPPPPHHRHRQRDAPGVGPSGPHLPAFLYDIRVRVAAALQKHLSPTQRSPDIVQSAINVAAEEVASAVSHWIPPKQHASPNTGVPQLSEDELRLLEQVEHRAPFQASRSPVPHRHEDQRTKAAAPKVGFRPKRKAPEGSVTADDVHGRVAGTSHTSAPVAGGGRGARPIEEQLRAGATTQAASQRLAFRGSSGMHGGSPSGGHPSGGPASGGPASGGPASGGPASGGPASGGPASGGPASGGPASGGPASGGPASGGPASGGPQTGSAKRGMAARRSRLVIDDAMINDMDRKYGSMKPDALDAVKSFRKNPSGPVYSAEYIARIICWMRGGASQSFISEALGIPPSNLSEWSTKAREYSSQSQNQSRASSNA